MVNSQSHPLGYESKVIGLSGRHFYRYVDVHPPEGTKTIITALLLHGFPDSASQPTTLEDYSTQRQSDDLEQLVHRAGVPEGEKIVVIAHDWGAITANRLIQFKPYLFKAAVNLCVPFIPRSPEYVPLENLIELYPNFQYQAFLASHESTAIMNANVERFIQVMFTSAKQREEGKVPDLEKTGVIENWLKDQSQTVTSELLTKEESDTMVDEIKAGVGFGYAVPLLY
ncbi:Ndr family, partial [Rhizoctonia solani]